MGKSSYFRLPVFPVFFVAMSSGNDVAIINNETTTEMLELFSCLFFDGNEPRKFALISIFPADNFRLARKLLTTCHIDGNYSKGNF